MLVFKVITCKYKVTGERKDRVKRTITLNNKILHTVHTEPYGLSEAEVLSLSDIFLESLRSALMLSNLNSRVIREDV